MLFGPRRLKFTVCNRGAEPAALHLIPQLWYRNTWSWGYDAYRPSLRLSGPDCLEADHQRLGIYRLYWENSPEILFCDNDSNLGKLFNVSNEKGFFKDGINEYVVHQDVTAVNPQLTGTKAGVHYTMTIAGHSSQIIRLRLTKTKEGTPFSDFEAIFSERIKETDEFYAEILCKREEEDVRRIQRQKIPCPPYSASGWLP